MKNAESPNTTILCLVMIYMHSNGLINHYIFMFILSINNNIFVYIFEGICKTLFAIKQI